MSKYEILYPDAFPVIKYHLNKGEQIKAESDAMIAMSSTIDVTGRAEGGIFRGLARMVSGESFFFQYLNAVRGDGDVILGHSIPGGIIDVNLDNNSGMVVQKDGFLAATMGIDVSNQTQNLAQGLLSREGLFVLKVKGNGTVFISSYGAIHPINLKNGEEIIVDNGHLVAWDDTMQYKIERASTGWGSSFASGECLVCRFKGPGLLLIQTRNPSGLRRWIGKN